MGFTVRKSFNFGLFRINLSKSGIGISLGIPGFRVGIRPTGSAYLHSGKYGIQYRKEFGKELGRKLLKG